jgi:hypothetical protein
VPKLADVRPKRRTESTILAEVRVAINAIHGCRVWRNTTGFVETEGRKIRYGLAPGSADLIGSAWGRALAIETKSERGRLSADQETWLEVVRGLGWIVVVAGSASEAVDVVMGEKR